MPSVKLAERRSEYRAPCSLVRVLQRPTNTFSQIESRCCNRSFSIDSSETAAKVMEYLFARNRSMLYARIRSPRSSGNGNRCVSISSRGFRAVEIFDSRLVMRSDELVNCGIGVTRCWPYFDRQRRSFFSSYKPELWLFYRDIEWLRRHGRVDNISHRVEAVRL